MDLVKRLQHRIDRYEDIAEDLRCMYDDDRPFSEEFENALFKEAARFDALAQSAIKELELVMDRNYEVHTGGL